MTSRRRRGAACREPAEGITFRGRPGLPGCATPRKTRPSPQTVESAGWSLHIDRPRREGDHDQRAAGADLDRELCARLEYRRGQGHQGAVRPGRRVSRAPLQCTLALAGGVSVMASPSVSGPSCFGLVVGGLSCLALILVVTEAIVILCLSKEAVQD